MRGTAHIQGGNEGSSPGMIHLKNTVMAKQQQLGDLRIEQGDLLLRHNA